MEKQLGLGIDDIDVVKKYWNDRPCNIRHSSKEIGTVEYFNEVSAKRYKVEPHILMFAEFEKWAGKKVLEIGCGIGTDASEFLKKGAEYTGLDLSEESLKVAAQRFKTFGYSGLLHLSDAENLDFLPENHFDLIYSFGVIHHTPNPKKIIENSHRVLARNGELRIMVYAKDSWKSLMIEGGFDQPEAQYGCPIAFSFDKSDVQDLLGGLFHIESITQTHIFPFIIDEYKKNNYVKESYFESMPDNMFKFLSEKLGWHMLIVAKKI